ncbi:LysR family transcriptional regulator [Shimia abyssi]|uniref:LysR family transcriptional regulator n=1 Tax=Shimia abyssi TaxID=1662395 RepID=A0A2P8F8U7_9RHOB|nr:LysR family transcriptional regulator [Shimia abyssi]PSL18147.1 LysR family transcriptional regulator [Shimia abyssi]
MLMKGVTIRGLEVFEALAKTGSVALTAEATGLSQPAVSQQIRNLETALGADLLDRSKRPMQLTGPGRSYQSRTATVLSQLRLAQSELTVMDLAHLTQLSMGIIDDFDNDLTPRLVTTLAESLTNCQFRLITAPSHEISQALRDRELHLGVAASTGDVTEGITEYSLARDPFVLVAPTEAVAGATHLLDVLSDLPMLRYEREQLISRQIETHLKSCGLTFADRFEIGSNPTLLSMVSRGIGWAITTPLSYFRAARFHEHVSMYPLPFAPLSRNISLYAREDWAETVPRDVAQTLRTLLQKHMIDPVTEQFPWLEGHFEALDI